MFAESSLAVTDAKTGKFLTFVLRCDDSPPSRAGASPGDIIRLSAAHRTLVQRNMHKELVAAIDLGSNSFRLQVGRIVITSYSIHYTKLYEDCIDSISYYISPVIISVYKDDVALSGK